MTSMAVETECTQTRPSTMKMRLTGPTIEHPPRVQNILPAPVSPFSRLPPEIREMIWNLAMHSRIIPWHRYLPDRPPPLYHTCHESRMIWLEKHKIQHWNTRDWDQERTLFIDYHSDILYFEGQIPGFKNCLGWEIPLQMSARTMDVYSADVEVFDPGLWIESEDPDVKWLGEVQRLAIPAKFALKELPFQNPWNGSQYYHWRWWSDYYTHDRAAPWAKLNRLCPRLRELIVIFGRTAILDRNCVSEDLIEVGRCEIPVETWNWMSPLFRVKSYVAKNIPRVKKVRVKFMEARNSHAGLSHAYLHLGSDLR